MENAANRVRCPVTLVEHSADPFASPHTAVLQLHMNASRVEVIQNGRVPLEATASAFAAALLSTVPA